MTDTRGMEPPKPSAIPMVSRTTADHVLAKHGIHISRSMTIAQIDTAVDFYKVWPLQLDDRLTTRVRQPHSPKGTESPRLHHPAESARR